MFTSYFMATKKKRVAVDEVNELELSSTNP
jgi:hypothetical protein